MGHEEFAKRFANNLKRIRNQVGMTQEEVAARACIHRTEVSLLERAGRTPRADMIVKLSSALGVPVYVFFEGLRWSPPGNQGLTTGKFEIFPEEQSETSP